MKKRYLTIIGVLLVGLVMASPVKSSIATRGINYSKTTPTPSYSAADYIQDGLVALWDGIENAGWGLHDNNATNWVCLVDNRFDLTLPGTAKIEDDSVLLSAAIIPFPSTFTLPNVGITIEVCHNPAVLSFDLFCAGSHAYETPKIRTVKVGDVYLFTNSYFPDNDVNMNRHNKSVAVALKPITNTFVGRYVYSVLQYNNGVSADDISNSSGWGYYVHKKQIGKYSGNLMCIRAYTRVLTVEEIKHNYKIDKARFNLP